jgi:hypothetical protein
MRYLVGLVCVLALFITGCGDEGGVCASFCAKDFECYSPQERIPRCEEACRWELGVDGDLSAECGDPAVSPLACVANLQTCEEVDNYWYEIPPDSYPCKAADDAAESACLIFGPHRVRAYGCTSNAPTSHDAPPGRGSPR